MTYVLLLMIAGLAIVARLQRRRMDNLSETVAALHIRIKSLDQTCKNLVYLEQKRSEPVTTGFKTAHDLIMSQKQRGEEKKRSERGPRPVSWTGKAALLEALTEDPNFERAQEAHKEL